MTKRAEKGDVGAIHEFARILLPYETPEKSVAHLFGLPSKHCLWAIDAADFASKAFELDSAENDAYFGISLRKTGLSKFVRGLESDLTYVLGVGIDVDVVVDGVDSKKKRFETVQSAVACVANAVPVPPTMIVHSGGGLHMHWLYKEPFEILTESDRNLASNVAMEWNKKISAAASDAGGYSVDSVFDLTRVFRIPGTLNRKIPGLPRLVKLLESDSSIRYEPKELADSIGLDPETLTKKTSAERATLGDKLQLDPNAEPPLAKKLALLENDDKFRALLRRDAVCSKWLKDTSASAFDLAIANILVRVGWSDQEITDMLISNRRQHNNDLKLREKYYSDTIGLARKGYDGTTKTAKEVDSRIEMQTRQSIESVASIPDKNEQREEIFAHLFKATGVDVVRIVSNGRDPARYRVHLRDGVIIHIESTTMLRRQDTWLEKALETNSEVPIYPLSKQNWRLLLSHLSRVLEFEKEGDSLMDAVGEYIERAIDITGDNREQRGGMLASGRPVFLSGGNPAIHLPSFAKWMADSGKKMEASLLKARLLSSGFKPVTLSFKHGGQGSSRTYWVIPKSVSRMFKNEDSEFGAEVINLDDGPEPLN